MQSTIIILILTGILVIIHLLSRGYERREEQRKKEYDAFYKEFKKRHISKKP